MCGVTECPVTNLFFVSRGWQQGRESATNEDTLVTLVKQLETSSCVPAMVVQSPFGPLFLSLCVLHVDSVTFSPLEGNRVPCEPKLIILETFRLYSKLISCTRKISTLHLEFKCVFSFFLCSGFLDITPRHAHQRVPSTSSKASYISPGICVTQSFCWLVSRDAIESAPSAKNQRGCGCRK